MGLDEFYVIKIIYSFGAITNKGLKPNLLLIEIL